MTEQTVAQTDDQSATGTEDTGEQNLDAILDEFDGDKQSASQDQPQTDQSTDGEMRDTVAFLRQQEERRMTQQTNSDIDKAVDAVKGDRAVDRNLVHDFVYGRFSRDERMLRVFQNRDTNPTDFNRVLDALGKELGESLSSQPDPQLTGDREAMRAAVSGQTSTPLPEENFDDKISSMSDEEFAQWRAGQ